MSTHRSFAFESSRPSTKERIDEFIRWAEPSGTGGFDQVHRNGYDRNLPYFDYGPNFLPHSHASKRCWFVKQEFLHLEGVGLYSRSRADPAPTIKKPLAMIEAGRFLSFAKAYLNVYCEIRRLRSAATSTLKALIYLEKALRELNAGDNDPSQLSHLCFHRAALAIQNSNMAPSVCFDAGKALEHLSMLVQAGGRFKGDKVQNVFPGFKLVYRSFVFRSPIKTPPKFGRKRPSEESAIDSGHLTSEEVAAVGLAFRRSVERFGPNSIPTYFAALMSLPLTTASMRASELQSLREDALYEVDGRHRLRVPRPKIGVEQDLPVSRILGSLSAEIFDIIRKHSAEAREALAFYVQQSPESIAGIQKLFVPKKLRPLFKNPYVTAAQAHAILDSDCVSTDRFPRCLVGRIPITHFVEKPGDIDGCKRQQPVVKIRDLILAMEPVLKRIELPAGTDPDTYVLLGKARKLLRFSTKNKRAMSALHKFTRSSNVKVSVAYMASADIAAHLLSDFKSTSNLPHWPYTSKDRSIRLDSALALHYDIGNNPHRTKGQQRSIWWRPRLVSIQVLNRWISGREGHGRLLFHLTNVRLSDGALPSISVHRTRRYHHTAALLAGASPLFADELAGRQSGWQGNAYDYRSPMEIVRGSIDTYDPDQESEVIGPIVEHAPSLKRIVARRIFLSQNAAPKHVHETGGCVRDLSLEPCDEFGDCLRCDKHVWRKNDQKRLQGITEIRNEALRIIPIATAKLRANPRLKSISKYLQQQEEVLARCDEILRVESDPTIERGTLVTFPAAPTLMTGSELRARNRKKLFDDKFL